MGYEKSGKREVYYIPYSKEKVDEIIEKSTGSDKDTIIFLFQDGPLGYEFPYDKFVIKVRDLYFTIEKKVQKESGFSQDEAELLLYEKFREAMKNLILPQIIILLILLIQIK